MKIYSLFLLLFCFILLSGCKEENPLPKEEPKVNVCIAAPDDKYTSCVKEKDTTTFEIATWNIEQFPKTNNTISALEELINNFHSDLIAVQEIVNASEFFVFDELMPLWDFQLVQSSGLNLGFIYNSCEIINVSQVKEVNIGDNYSFPRKPIEITVTHKNGLEVTFINIHLKCCDNGYERRIAASQLLETYISDNHPDKNVVLIGDFNDNIKDETSPFNNFIQNSANYQFADMSIALGPTTDYSYPGWPSHIDHILVSNELFDNLNYTEVIKFENCYSTYGNIVSDHRPVLISLTADQ